MMYFCLDRHRLYFTLCSFFFFFNDTATTEIYTLSLHDALPIRTGLGRLPGRVRWGHLVGGARSEEHTSELQSQSNLVCRLLLEKKKTHIQRLQQKQLKEPQPQKLIQTSYN